MSGIWRRTIRSHSMHKMRFCQCLVWTMEVQQPRPNIRAQVVHRLPRRPVLGKHHEP